MILRGLLASREQPRMATSNDAIGMLTFSGTSNEVGDAREVVTAVELKTHVSQASIIATTRRLTSLHRLNGQSAFAICEFGSEVFQLLVPTVDRRIQCIHHAVVDRLNNTLYVAASTQRILYAVLVSFDDNMILAYKEAISYGLAQISLEFIKRIPIEDLGYAVDQQTISCWRKLSEAILDENQRRRLSREAMLSPAHAILPSAVSLWNNVKGGQDVVSRILKNVKVDFRSLTPRAFIWFRLVLLSLMNSHLIYRLFHVSTCELHKLFLI